MTDYVPSPVGEKRDERYRVSLNGGAEFYPDEVTVSAEPYNTVWPGFQRPAEQTEKAAYCSFAACGSTEVTVTVGYPFRTAVIRPLSAGVVPVREGDTLRFTLPETGQYVLEIDGFHGALHLFADEPDESVPEHAVVYEPGVHHIGSVRLKSGDTVYLARGAVVYGAFTAVGAENITVCGAGVLDGSFETRTDAQQIIPNTHTYGKGNLTDRIVAEDPVLIEQLIRENQMLDGCFRFYKCRNVRVSGVTVRDAAGFSLIAAACENFLIERVKLVGLWKYNTDGFDLLNSSNVVISDCFLRTFDDSVVLKGIKGWDSRGLENITVKRCVVWCDWGRNLEIGAETTADEYRNILFEDCDLIHGAHIYMDIQNTGRAYVHDVTFRNIRCEYQASRLPAVYQSDMTAPYPASGKAGSEQPLLMFAASYDGDMYGGETANGKISDIRFEDIHVLAEPGVSMPRSQFLGLDAEHGTRNVTVKNLTFNGVRITEWEKAAIEVNGFAEAVLE